MGKLAPTLAFLLMVAALFAPPAKALTYREFFVKSVLDTAVLCDTYTVQPGDFVLEVMRLKGQIAYRAFPEFMRVFLALNPTIKNINTIYPGQELVIPLKILGPSSTDGATGEPVRLPFLSVWPGGEQEQALSSHQAGPDSPIYSMPYQVRRGDTVSSIIEKHYAPASADDRQRALDAFLEANPLIKDKNVIFAGETLYLPVAEDMAGMEALAADAPDLPAQDLGPALAFGASSYRVKAGDTVSSLLSQQFGPVDSASYKQALDAFVRLNPQVKDINRIFAGNLIALPQAVEQEQVFADAQVETAPAPTEPGLPLKAAVRDKPEEIPAIAAPALVAPPPAPAVPPEPELPVKAAVRDKPEEIQSVEMPAARPALAPAPPSAPVLPAAPQPPPASVAPPEPELPVKVAVKDKPEQIPAVFEPPPVPKAAPSPAPVLPPEPVAPPEPELPVKAAVRDKPEEIRSVEMPAARPAPPPEPVAPPEPELPVKVAVKDKPEQIPAVFEPPPAPKAALSPAPVPPPAPVASPEPELPLKVAVRDKPEEIRSVEMPAARPAPPLAPVPAPMPVPAPAPPSAPVLPAAPQPPPAPVAPSEPELPVKAAVKDKPKEIPAIAAPASALALAPAMMPPAVDPAPEKKAKDEQIRMIISGAGEQEKEKPAVVLPSPKPDRADEQPSVQTRPVVVSGQPGRADEQKAPSTASKLLWIGQTRPAPAASPPPQRAAAPAAPSLPPEQEAPKPKPEPKEPEKAPETRPAPPASAMPAPEEPLKQEEPKRLAAILAAIMEPAAQSGPEAKPAPPVPPAPQPLTPPVGETGSQAEPEPIKEEILPEKPLRPQPEPVAEAKPPDTGGISPVLDALEVELLSSGTYFFPRPDGPDLALDLSIYPAALLPGGGRALLYSAGNPPNPKDLAAIGQFWKQLALVQIPAKSKPVDVLIAVLEGAGISWTREKRAFSANFATVTVVADLFVQPRGKPVLAVSWIEKALQATDPAMVDFLASHNIKVLEIADGKPVKLPGAAPANIPAPVVADAPACQDLAAMLFAFAQVPYAVNVPVTFPYAGFEVKVLTNMARLHDGREIIVDLGNIQGQAKEHLQAMGLAVLSLPGQAQSAELSKIILEAAGATINEPPIFAAAKRERPAPATLTLPGLLAKWPEAPPAFITPAPLDSLLGQFLHSRGLRVLVIAQPQCR